MFYAVKLKLIQMFKKPKIFIILVVLTIIFTPSVLFAQIGTSTATSTTLATSTPFTNFSNATSTTATTTSSTTTNITNIVSTSVSTTGSGVSFWSWFANLFSSTPTSSSTGGTSGTVNGVVIGLDAKSLDEKTTDKKVITKIPAIVDCDKVATNARTINNNETKNQKFMRLLAGAQEQDCIKIGKIKPLPAPIPAPVTTEINNQEITTVTPDASSTPEDTDITPSADTGVIPQDNPTVFDNILNFFGL